MKKTYKTPLTEVVKVNAVQLICQSIVDVSGLKGVTKGGEFGGGASDSKDFEDFEDFEEDLW